MELPHNIKIEKTLQVFASSKQNITSMQSGIFATSHVKGPCDAIGGILKRMAGDASLAKPLQAQKNCMIGLIRKVIKIHQKCHLVGYHMKNMNKE